MLSSQPNAVRTYRIYLRDGDDRKPPHEVDLASDHEARELAWLMLAAQTHYALAEIWDRARLVCTVERDEVMNRG